MDKFKSSICEDPIYITQGFSKSHPAIDFSSGKCGSDMYSPERLGDGVCWKIITSYSFTVSTKRYYDILKSNGYKLPAWNGKSFTISINDAPIVHLKHDNGKGSRFIHSEKNKIYIKPGQRFIAGKTKICSIGKAGVASGCHCHYEVLKSFSELSSRIDPELYLKDPKPAAKPITVEGDRTYFTVQKGGWRSNIVQEVIKYGFWSGKWRDHLDRFNSLNPTTPTGGWKPGQKVLVDIRIKPTEELKPVETTDTTKPPVQANIVLTPESTATATVQKPQTPTEQPTVQMTGQVVTVTSYGNRIAKWFDGLPSNVKLAIYAIISLALSKAQEYLLNPTGITIDPTLLFIANNFLTFSIVKLNEQKKVLEASQPITGNNLN